MTQSGIHALILAPIRVSTAPESDEMFNAMRPGLMAKNSLVAVAVALASAVVTLPAHAGLLQGPITVGLYSPGGITTDGGATTSAFPGPFIDTVSVADGIHANDGADGFVDTNIGGFMLPGEFISFSGASDISLRLGAGSQDDRGTSDPLDDVLATGYLDSLTALAQYQFSGLGIAGKVITGFTVSGSGFTAPTNLGSLIHFDAANPGSLSIDLASMRFAPDGRGAIFAGGNLEINFVASDCVPGAPGCGNPPNPVPEPASLALVLLALAAVPAARRRPDAKADR